MVKISGTTDDPRCELLVCFTSMQAFFWVNKRTFVCVSSGGGRRGIQKYQSTLKRLRTLLFVLVYSSIHVSASYIRHNKPCSTATHGKYHSENHSAFYPQRIWFFLDNSVKRIVSIELYSRLSLKGHLYKTDNSVKRTPRVGPCLSLLPLFDSL